MSADGLQIIGAGLGRTGTRSLQLALGTLGQPCFHMHELMLQRDRVRWFRDAHEGRPTDWDALFDGYTAAVDYPTALYWREIRERWPDAFVLLSSRPAEDWYRSTRETIYTSCVRAREAGSSPLMEYLWESIWDGFFGGRFEDPEHAMAVFRDHNAAVRAEVPADRLIEFPLGSGWAPLVDALGVEVPDAPYPHTNTSEAFRKRMEVS